MIMFVRKIIILATLASLTIAGEHGSSISHSGKSQLLILKIRIKRNDSNETTFNNLTISEEVLKKFNITKNQLENGWLEINGEDEEIVLNDGRRIKAAINVEELGLRNYTVKDTTYKPAFQSLEDLTSDASLYSIQPKVLKWSFGKMKNYSEVKIVSSVYRIDAWLNNSTEPIFSLDVGPLLLESNGAFWSPDEGIVLTTINMWTGKVSLHESYATNDFGVYRILNWVLDRILPGSLVLLVSLHAGSLNFHESTREKLTSFGSTWPKYYLYRDNWILSYIQGGPILADILLPNLGLPQLYSSPMITYFALPESHLKNFPEECNSWPKTKRWKARRSFCASYNGLRSLCDCDSPFYFRRENSNTTFDPKTDIPISILTSEGRLLMLYRLLENLGKQEGLRKSLIVIFLDEFAESVQRLAFILGIKTRIHRAEGTGGTRISRILRFSLYQSIKIFVEAKFFINLEDDLVLSEDFYSFMVQASPIFELDQSVWCVSAFNIFSYSHTSRDPSLLLRGAHTPSLGWMMHRDTIEEILPKWPPAEIYHNWDFFLAREDVNKGRICIHPDVIRSNHPFGGGTHFQPSLFMERHYSTRKLNQDKHSTLRPLTEVTKSVYEKAVIRMVREASPIEITNLQKLKIPNSENGTFVIFQNKTDYGYINSSRVLHHAFGIWDGPQIFVNGIERFFYYNSTILIVSVPCNCSFDVPEGYKFFRANEDEISKLLNEESNAIENIIIQTHENGFQLPIL